MTKSVILGGRDIIKGIVTGMVMMAIDLLILFDAPNNSLDVGFIIIPSLYVRSLS
jgi:hypothetical protein